ncbi:DNA binding protein [Phytophthora cinnamomi]|uniref:DNA binding protein n=1 Tax=Phytophthora cinnamomi TaxID=4785 RepID=UPI0035599432|nr:DNA binding protein [Phytophthora cinnamomi]
MANPEISSVWGFVVDTNLDEIFSASDAPRFLTTVMACHSGSSFVSVDEAEIVVKTETTAVPFNSDDERTSDEDVKPVTNAPPTKLEIKRLRQHVYDKKYREKRKVTKVSLGNDFVAGLKLLNLLLEDRVQRTRMVALTMRLVALEQDSQPIAACERDRKTILKEAKQQLSLNRTATKFAKKWTTTWTRVKVEKGKFFLKGKAADINLQIQDLVKHRETLTEATAELEWCMQQKATGVWP